MMTIKKSSQWKRLWALAVLPVIALALMAFANPSNTTASVVANESPTQDNKVYETVDQLPEFPGGMEAMVDFLSKNVNYPEHAAKNNIEGRVVLQFVVEKTGEIGEIKVARSVDEELDAEAIRVVRSMPNFIPGRKDGKDVAVWYALPIVFKLSGDGK